MVDEQILPDIHPRNNPDGLLLTALGRDDNTVSITDLYDEENVCEYPGATLIPANNTREATINMLSNAYPVICGGIDMATNARIKHCQVYGLDNRKLPFAIQFQAG